TGDKVTLKTGAVIDLSGKEGGETYLGGDERGEGKNGIQLAKKTTLEKGSIINVSGKEKGGRAIVWGDIALINGNINAQGSDIAKTGGFVETSGHHLSINNNAIVKAKEWLLDPDNVEIRAPDASRRGTEIGSEFPTGTGELNDPKKNDQSKTILTNTTISNFLKNTHAINITASKKLTVNGSINIGSGSHLYLYSEGQGGNGIEINEDITSEGGNLTINSRGWVDIHKNITLGTGFLNITSNDSVAFEGRNKNRRAAVAQITAQGTIRLTGEGKTFRLNNVSLNGTGNDGLRIMSLVGNLSHRLDGEINISGNVTINQTTPKNIEYWRAAHKSHWNVSSLNLQSGANFTFIKYTDTLRHGNTGNRDLGGVDFRGLNGNMSFNIGKGASVKFKLKASEAYRNDRNKSPIEFSSNISVEGGGSVDFNIYANTAGRGANLSMRSINVSGNSNLTFTSQVRATNAFTINNDLTINATNSNFTLKQAKDHYADTYNKNAISSTHNLTILGGNVTLGGENSSSSITGNISIKSGANVTLQAHKGGSKLDKERTLTLGNIFTDGNLSLIGSNADITGNLTVKEGAKFNGETNDSLNITGTFTNNGTSIIDVKKGAAKLGNITNEGSLNITTHAKTNQKTIITGNITNKKGDLNIRDNKNNAEIQIGGNISQKEGNLTISSDKVNITKQITIKAGVNGENSDSGTENNANLTIKTKTLELTNDLNISGFHKAEITAKDNSDLIIGKASSDSGNAGAQKVIFDKVKDSKISAGNHNVTLNSEVETSNGNSNAAGDSNGNNAGLTISAKDVAVNNNITSHKTINISATTGNVTTKEGTTINATTGGVEVTAKTGDIKGEVKSSSGSVTLTATGEALTVSNISGGAVTITAGSGKLTTTENSIINATANSVTISTKQGELKGAVEAKKNSVDITATGDALTVSNVTAKNDVTVKAETGKLTTTSGGTIKSEESKVELTAQSGLIDGNVEGKNQVNVTANTGSLTIESNAKVEATDGAATLTATGNTLTTKAGSVITSNKGQTTLTANNSDIAGSINAANVTLNTTGTLTTTGNSKINATSGTLVINA
ncbi:beta strand repeat-containing protein, partial [Haemophilus influenzae]|uniref:beta strand repeat-containing protein n=1 Tax=Haemophilus influenzae TaxID=727 RepID=UPI000667C558